MPIQVDDDEACSLKLFVVLSKAYRTVMERAIKDMKQYGLSPSEFMVLELLFTKGRIPLQQIGEKILITSGSITYNVDKLEKKEYLKRVPCKEDRRVIYAEITELGNKFFSRIFPKHAAKIHSLLNGVSPDEIIAATELLKKIGKGAETG
jgi:MarR family transcriptional regulator, 2-MHQ and catechol-resistance regulon repressor